MKFLLKCILLLLLSTFLVNAQSISITKTDFDNVRTVGTTGTNYTTPLGTTVEVFVGEASSEAQYWDFSELEYIHGSDAIFVSPSTAPSFSYFPNSNLVVKESSVFGDQTFIAYTYQGVEDNQFVTYGNGDETEIPFMSYKPFAKVLSLPLSYGQTWTTEYDFEMDGIVISSDSVTYTVDAFGTIKLPHGEFPALRVTTSATVSFYTKGIEQVMLLFAGEVVPTGSAQAGVVYSEGNNPNSVENNETTISGYKLNQNYPNPFNPTTTISFTIPERAYTEINVTNVLGENIAELCNKELNAGTYKLHFDASKQTSGIFFYTIRTNSYFETKKMILIK